MKAIFVPALGWRAAALALALCALSAPARALQADREQPLHVLADQLQYDDVDQHAIYTGHVLVTKGSIRVQADRVDVWHGTDGFDHARAFGSPKHLAQFDEQLDPQPGQPPSRMHGRALQLDWDGAGERVIFEGQADLQRYAGEQLSDRAQGQRIVYDDLTARFSAQAGPGGVSAANPSGRVRMMLRPRREASAPAPAQAAASAAATTQAPR